ncbi:hypothetical protein Acr_26g0014680 [Actinidia rufa]|uniref:Uncharacterized protein n=1 Tax=Actinidia rufa TaxID=165716 RepID=A0A7J0H565_9ERIC|nr:hypothetical protein Acr_26g0014680 [Actinidia rufa]
MCTTRLDWSASARCYAHIWAPARVGEIDWLGLTSIDVAAWGTCLRMTPCVVFLPLTRMETKNDVSIVVAVHAWDRLQAKRVGACGVVWAYG